MKLASVTQEGSIAEPKPMVIPAPSLRRRILVVDHNDELRLLACDRLKDLGFDAVGEDNGVSGLARLVQDKPCDPFTGMLLEIDMPVIGGMAVLQEMKDRHPDVPVIVMAEARLIEKLRDAVTMWAREYLVKPYDVELMKRKCALVFIGTDQAT
ncbi:response regulator [Petrachloros mirabilis]